MDTKSAISLPETAPAAAAKSSSPTLVLEKPCPLCGELIKPEVRRCHHCQSDLGWRRHLTFTGTGISIVAAVIAVLAAATPAWQYLVFPNTARLRVEFVAVSPDGSNGSVVVLGSNEGRATGAITGGTLYLFWNSKTGAHQTHIPLSVPGRQPVFIAPSSSEPVSLQMSLGVVISGASLEDVQALFESPNPGGVDNWPFWSVKLRVFVNHVGGPTIDPVDASPFGFVENVRTASKNQLPEPF